MPCALARQAAPSAPLGAQPPLQESAQFYGDSSPAKRRLSAPLGAQPTRQESAPFYGADSYARIPRIGCPSTSASRKSRPPKR